MLVSTCRVELRPDLRRGYLLHITNLEDQALDYLVTFVVTVHTGVMSSGPPASEVERFAAFTGDAHLVEQPFRRFVGGQARIGETGHMYSASVRLFVGGKRTSRLGIEPPFAGGILGALFGGRTFAFSRLEGYVALRLPPVRSRERRFLTQPQASGPVRVLVNPETRTIYYTGGGRAEIYDDIPPFPNPLGGLAGQPNTFDPPPEQRGYSYLPSRAIERTEPLHIATGKAENELTPDGSRSFTAENVQYAIEALKNEDTEATEYRGAGLVAEPDRAGALIELLGEVGNDAALVRTINQVLKEQKAAVRIRTGDE